MLYTKCFDDCINTVDNERKYLTILFKLVYMFLLLMRTYRFISLHGTARGKHLVQWVTENPPPVRKNFIIPNNRKNMPIETYVATKLSRQYDKLSIQYGAGATLELENSVVSSEKEQQAKNMNDFYAEMKLLNDNKMKDDNKAGKDEASKSKNIQSLISSAKTVKPTKLSSTERFEMLNVQKLASANDLVDIRKSRSTKVIIGTSKDIQESKLKLINASSLAKETRALLIQKNVDPKSLNVSSLGHASSTQTIAPSPTVTTAALLSDKSRDAIGNSNACNRKLSMRTSPSRLRADTLYMKANNTAALPSAVNPSGNTLPPIRESNSAPVLIKSDKAIAKLNSKLSMIVNNHAPINDESNPVTANRRSIISRIPVNNLLGEKLTRRTTTIIK